jgi:hypothetical protein
VSDQFECLDDKHIAFIEQQSLFFVATADSEGLVNVSPKGMDSLRVIDNRHLVWLNLTGSGNETAAHVLAHDRMTLMWCSFDKEPLILRVYGHARVCQPAGSDWQALQALFPAYHGARQIFSLDLNLVQSSCGFAVPLYDFVSERTVLNDWAKNRGQSGITQYWQDENRLSLDNKDTGMK